MHHRFQRVKSHQHQHQHLAGQAAAVGGEGGGGGDGHSFHSMETAAASSAASTNTSQRVDMTEDGAQVIVYFIRPDPTQVQAVAKYIRTIHQH